jgi:acetoin utilization protein AcuB
MLIGSVMTKHPWTIGSDQPLVAAHTIMREHNIRHLPVLAEGKVVGIVSQRDLHLVETLLDVDPRRVTVDEAMTPEPYTVGPRASVARVARDMARTRHGSAVVMERGKVVGIFTTTDALALLARLA